MKIGWRIKLFACLLPLALPGAAMAKELPGLTTPTRQSDWNQADRSAFVQARENPVAGSMPFTDVPARRFYEAFKVNLKAGAAGEYATIMQRHAFYMAMGLTLHRIPDIDRSLRCIRFFDAAASVTTATLLGAAETLAGQLVAGLDDTTVDAIAQINAMLFARNVSIMKMLVDRKKPFDPLQPSAATVPTAMAFDLAMVQLEQRAVEDFLATRPQLRTATILQQVSAPNRAEIAGHYFSGQGGPVARLSEMRDVWLPAVGVPHFSFEQLNDRIAMGEALVFFLHHYGVTEFKTYRSNHTIPMPNCSGTLP